MKLTPNLYDFATITEVDFKEYTMSLQLSKEFFDKYAICPAGLVKITGALSGIVNSEENIQEQNF